MTAGSGTARFNTLQAWLQWQESLHPSTIELGLDRICAVATVLFGEDFFAQQPLTITVAGTNGKGSCVTTLSVLLQALGKRVGSFTSPHLFRYNERIRIDNREVSDEDLCAAFAAIDVARGDISLTYFEFNTLAALWLFRLYAVDVQVLEVGLGGRLDAVNLVNADVAVITNIALDHTDWLGDTREKIGAEKAGILRRAGKLVYGEAEMPDSIRGTCVALGVTVRQWGTDFSAGTDSAGCHWRGVDGQGNPLALDSATPPLPLPSVACGLQALAWLDLWDAELFARCLPQITLPGRMQQVAALGCHWILDVAHNEAGARFLVARLQVLLGTPVTAVFSAMADKDLAGIFSALAPAVQHWILFPLVDNPRAATVAQLRAAALQAGIAETLLQDCVDVSAATAAAAAYGKSVLACGSFFTVAAVAGELADVA